MTIKEARKILDNTKVYVSDKSEAIQEKLFDIGYHWESNGKIVSNLDAPFLFIDNDTDYIGYDYYMNYFLKNPYKEIFVNDILSINIDKEENKFNFRPFDKVLVRDLDGDVWIPALFSNIVKRDYFLKDRYETIAINPVYEQCIPYNDKTKHLLGTNKDYEE
jgi:hypothetical protein